MLLQRKKERKKEKQINDKNFHFIFGLLSSLKKIDVGN